MSINTLSGLALRDRKFNSYGQENLPITDGNHTGSPTVFQLGGGIVKSGVDTYANRDGVPFTFDTQGNLKVLVLGSIILGSVSANVDSVFQSSGNVFVQSGNVYLQSGNNLHVQGIGSVDAALTVAPVYVGYKAESTVPTEVADGDAVDQWTDTFGRQVGVSDNLGIGARDVNEVAPWGTQVIEVTMDNAATAAGSSASVNVIDKHHHTWVIQHTGSPTITHAEWSIDDTVWFSAGSVVASGNYNITVSDTKYKFVRSNITTLTSGTGKTVTTKFLGGN